MSKLLKYFLDENALVYIISMIYDFTTKICSSENINMTTDYLFLNWHEATRGVGDGGGDGMGVWEKYLSTYLTIYIFLISMNTWSPSAGVKNDGKSKC